MTPLHVCHVTTVHPWDDKRIFQRMCRSLAAKGLRVTLVAPVEEERTAEGVRVLPTGLTGKVARLCGGPWLLSRLRRVDADIYHFHDPELLPWMLLFQRITPRAAVIYDIHEYYPETLVASNYFGTPLFNRIMSRVVTHLEPAMARRLRGVIGVTEPILERFHGGPSVVEVIRNVVDLTAIPEFSAPPELPGEYTLVIGGTIDSTRRMEELIAAIGLLRDRGMTVHLLCLGTPHPPDYAAALRALTAENGLAEQVGFHPSVSWQQYQHYISGSRLGLVLLADRASHSMSLPFRLCEFMAHRLPIVATDSPILAKVVRESGCGIVLDRCEPGMLADAIEYLLRHPEEATRMGAKGRRAVEDGYSWTNELTLLTEFYGQLVDRRPVARVEGFPMRRNRSC